MTVSQAYRLHTVASAVAEITGIAAVLLLSLVLR
jgi:H+/gluconate symporter-like permease